MVLPSIEDALVTASHPARNDRRLDHERCKILQDYLVAYGWVASGRPLDDLPRRSFFDVYQGDDAEAVRNRLDASLVALLESLTMAEQFDVPFYFWVSGITEPLGMFANEESGAQENENEDEPEPSRFLTLYSTNVGIGNHSAGLVYDQVRHRATMAMGIEDFGFARPVAEHEDLWYPLETVLSRWIDMIRLGKITAPSQEEDAPNEKYGPWTWHSYSAAQVDGTVTAFNRLVSAIEERMPKRSLLPARDGGGPLLTDADLDAASVPQDCFIRSVLTSVRVPRFKAIAPGLLVPHDAAAFAASQKFTVMGASSSEEGSPIIPPVLVFAVASGRTANFDSPSRYESLNPFIRTYRDGVPHGDHSTPAGLYSESVDRAETDNAEEGFRLILPFALRVNGEEGEGTGLGARKSDGQLVSAGSIAELFQHGFKPFGGEWWRAQRLERLLDRWRELVESGEWTVGNDGVDGDIDLFREADGRSWEKYWISPEW